MCCIGLHVLERGNDARRAVEVALCNGLAKGVEGYYADCGQDGADEELEHPDGDENPLHPKLLSHCVIAFFQRVYGSG